MARHRRFTAPAPRRVLHVLLCLLLAAVLLAGIAVEVWGGRGGIPTWGQLHRLLGLPAAAPEPALLQNAEASVSFLDVGQGDAVLIAQGGEYCLIDTGPPEAEAQLLAALRQAGVDGLRLLVLTHLHTDHSGNVSAVLDAFPVTELLLPPLTADGEEPWLYQMLRYRAQKLGTAVTAAETAQTFAVGEGTLTVLQAGYTAPPQQDYTENEAENDASLCLRYTLGAFAFLDTGDALAGAEQALVDTYGGALHATLLKAGHHGSYTSTGAALLRAASPQAVGISCGAGNDYGHPHDVVLQRLRDRDIPYARTDEQGTLTYLWQDGELTLTATGTADLAA